MNKSIVLLSALLVLWSCGQNQGKNEDAEASQEPKVVRNYEPISVIIKDEAEKALGGELMAAMQRGGVEEAVNYCNLNAIKITDSVAARYGAAVRRVTNKPRNPINQADEMAMEQMKEWEGILAANTGQVVSAVETETERNFYFPITIKPLCTTCHGVKGETLTDENYAHIETGYPADQATGYHEGDLRGLWLVSFKK